jgi:hypothetical protein
VHELQLELSFRSQFFQSLWHFSDHAKDASGSKCGDLLATLRRDGRRRIKKLQGKILLNHAGN